MSRAALTKLWSFFALTTLTLSFLFFLRTTGVKPGSDAFGILGYKASTIPILALPMNMALFAIVLWLTWVWSESTERGNWAQRIPLFYFDEKDVNPLTRGGRVYQRWSFVLALVVPMLLVGQMADRFFRGAVYGKPAGSAETVKVAEGVQLLDVSVLLAIPGLLRFGDPDGPQYFAVQAWVYALLLVLVLAAWLGVMRSVFRRR